MNAPLRHSPRPVMAALRERPFDGAVRTLAIHPNGRMPSIAEILIRMDAPERFAEICEARVNGEIVPRGAWHLVRPRVAPGRDVAITFTVPLRGAGGSGGGQKSTIALVATIAVLLIATAVSAGALGILTGSALLAAGTIGAAVAGAAVGIGGALAIAALIPPPRAQTNLPQASTTNPMTLQPAALTGNIIAPGAPLARVVGTMRVFPQLVCQPLVEIVGNLEYAEAVLAFAGPHALSALWVAGVDASSILELDYEFQEGKPGGPIQSLVTRQGFTLAVNLELSRHHVDPSNQQNLDPNLAPSAAVPQWHTFVTRNAPDEVWLDLSWIGGLFDNNATTSTINQPVRIRFRLRGTSAWTNAPELHFSANTPGVFEKSIRLKWSLPPSEPNQPPANQGPVYAFKHVPAQGSDALLVPNIGGWDADPYFSAGAGNDVLARLTLPSTHVRNMELYADKAIFYLDPATFTPGIYEIQVMRGGPYLAANFVAFTVPATVVYTYTATGIDVDNAIFDFFDYYRKSGRFSIPLDQGQMQDRVMVTRIASVWNQNPIQSGDLATISVRIHSQALAQLSVLASGYVRDWDGTGWNNLTTTSNPAPHFYDVLAGNLGANPLPVDLIDSAGLVSWRTACNTLGYTVNGVLEGKKVLDALNLIASCGYARLRHSETWGVFLDHNRSADAPVQIFTPRNMKNFNWTRAFAKRPSGFRAQFNDALNDYLPNEVVVFDDPVNQDASQLETIQYDGLVFAVDVIKRAKFDLLQSKLRFTFYKGDTDLESLIATRGDLVGVQHDILARQAGYARIKNVFKNGGIVTGLELDGTLNVSTDDAWSNSASAWLSYASAWAVPRAGLAIRLKGGNGISTHEISTAPNTDISVVNFVTPFADPGSSQLDSDCLVASGPLASEYRRLIVFGVNPAPDLTAGVIFVDEAPALWPIAARLLLEGDQAPGFVKLEGDQATGDVLLEGDQAT